MGFLMGFFGILLESYFLFPLFLVSHTTDDLIFTWDPKMPLDVDDGIELPQLELIETRHDDCTTVYSTGIKREQSYGIPIVSRVEETLSHLYFQEKSGQRNFFSLTLYNCNCYLNWKPYIKRN